MRNDIAELTYAIGGAPVFWHKEIERSLNLALKEQLALHKVPGIIAGLWVDGLGHWVGTAGTADLGTGRAPEPGDKVRIGSITKTFTSTAILRLADQGFLSIDDPLSRWEPWIPGSERILLRHLLNMTSGLVNYTDLDEFWARIKADPAERWAPEDLVKMAAAQPPRFATGTQAEYNNTNYILLGMIIEKASGMSAADYFSRSLTKPLGMENTFLPAGARISEPFMRGYTTAVGDDPESANLIEQSFYSPSSSWTAGGMIGTLGDLEKWMRALASGSLLSPGAHARQLDFSMPNTDDYGLGIVRGGALIGHAGEVPGYNCSMYRHQGIGLTGIVLVNRYPGLSKGVADRINVSLMRTLTLAGA
jgi:D-alanyl-D-alanine carboxypeptidase